MNVRAKTLAVIIAAVVVLHGSAVTASEITDQLKETIDGVIAVLRDPSLKGEDKKQERRARIRSIVKERFSFEEMAKRSLGRHWRKRSKEERNEFVKLFSSLIENSYIDRIEQYSNEKVLFLNEKVIGRKAEVRTKVVSAKGTEIPINYRLFKDRSGRWRVYDVVVEGVSLVRNYRTQFDKTIRSSSYEDLVKDLRAKVE